MNIKGTIHGRHIEDSTNKFTVKVLRPPCYNVIFRDEQWETWNVLAETEEGALRIAQYHFYNSNCITLVKKSVTDFNHPSGHIIFIPIEVEMISIDGKMEEFMSSETCRHIESVITQYYPDWFNH